MKYIEWKEEYHDELFEEWKQSNREQSFELFRREKWKERQENE